MMGSYNSYPKVWAVGHAALTNAGFMDAECVFEEKVDGSQFSFGVFGGELKCRSKGVQLQVDAPEGMFLRAVEAAKSLAPVLHDGWTYRAEYLQSPKHNTLAYSRIPVNHLIIFDIATGEEQYLSAGEKERESARIGLECVPVLHVGKINAELPPLLLDRLSILGNVKIEGFVMKPREVIFGTDKKPLIGKYVSEAFKEIHGKEWKKSNPTNSDIVLAIGERFATEARWQKAIQHHLENGGENDVKAIGQLIKAIQSDVLEEGKDEILEALWQFAKPSITRLCVRGFPEWFKAKLMADAIPMEAN